MKVPTLVDCEYFRRNISDSKKTGSDADTCTVMRLINFVLY